MVSLVCIAGVYRVKENVKKSTFHTHMIVMGVSLIACLTFGTVLGVLIHDNFATSTMIAILVGIAIGFFVGKPFGHVVVLGGMIEGIMGGMMGTMTGAMVHMSPNHTLFILFMNGLFLSVCIYILWCLNQAGQGDRALFPVKNGTEGQMKIQ